jgi:tetratricopeptide (TPR) repeat protein
MTGTVEGLLPFGSELRRLRSAKGIRLAELAKLVHYSKSHLSRIETLAKPASPDLVRRCDAVLDAGGALLALVNAAAHNVDPPPTPHQPAEVLMMTLGPEGRFEFGLLLAPDLLAAGGAPMLVGSAGPGRLRATDGGVNASLRAVFDQLRQLGQTLAPVDLLPTLISLTNSVLSLARRADAPLNSQLLVLASRIAEYAGWMAQEQGNPVAAVWLTDQAVALAAAGGDHDLAAYGHVRRALLALYDDDAGATIELAQRAQATPCTPRVHGLAAQREAQGHALAGDYDACRRSLDRAQALLARAADTTADTAADEPVLGTSTVVDPVAMTTGWCLHDLGRWEEAVELLTTEIARIPATAERARARYGARLALSLASIREIEQARAVVDPILAIAPRIDSATIRVDLRLLARTLNRWHDDPVVRDVMPRLTSTLRSSTRS